jgi:NAD(P)-dependent dehydrogenase (short-subunit alcohol dehydrogenase family)
MTTRFDGKVAIVTGAAPGIGRESALASGAAGASLVVADRAEHGMETGAQIEAAGGEAVFVRADMRSTAAVAAMVDEGFG